MVHSSQHWEHYHAKTITYKSYRTFFTKKSIPCWKLHSRYNGIRIKTQKSLEIGEPKHMVVLFTLLETKPIILKKENFILRTRTLGIKMMIFAKKTPKTPPNRKVLIPVYMIFFSGIKIEYTKTSHSVVYKNFKINP